MYSTPITHNTRGWSTGGTGVFGSSTATSGATYGVYGQSNSGIGVRGLASASTGTTYGVNGTSNSPAGSGGWFQNTNSGGKALVAATNTGTEALTVLASGNVGIGTAAPIAPLTVGSIGNWNVGSGWGDFSLTNGIEWSVKSRTL